MPKIVKTQEGKKRNLRTDLTSLRIWIERVASDFLRTCHSIVRLISPRLLTHVLERDVYDLLSFTNGLEENSWWFVHSSARSSPIITQLDPREFMNSLSHNRASVSRSRRLTKRGWRWCVAYQAVLSVSFFSHLLISLSSPLIPFLFPSLQFARSSLNIYLDIQAN